MSDFEMLDEAVEVVDFEFSEGMAVQEVEGSDSFVESTRAGEESVETGCAL